MPIFVDIIDGRIVGFFPVVLLLLFFPIIYFNCEKYLYLTLIQNFPDLHKLAHSCKSWLNGQQVWSVIYGDNIVQNYCQIVIVL